MFAVNGILFNHESPRRGETFVTRKITRAAARIKAGLQDDVCTWATSTPCATGATRRSTSRRCGGCCRPTSPDDYVLATGTAYTVRDFLEFAFEHVGLDWEKYVRFDERYLRPTEVDALIGDASRAARILGWKPTTYTPDLARLMVDADVRLTSDRTVTY